MFDDIRVGSSSFGWLLVAAGALQSIGCVVDASDGEMMNGESENIAAVEEPALYCNRTYSELTQGIGRPYNAVGFLNNGCTAFLIDADHIAAAGHCFTHGDGAWQQNLRFYPNFHPNRVTANATQVPRATVDRVVVGSRVNVSDASDWAIAHLTNCQNTAGLDLTPIALASSVPTAENTALTNPAYTRHHLPYNDNNAVTWDNMAWDSTNCSWVGNDGGMWAVTMKPAPFHNGVNRDMVGCNSRWSAGFIHQGCVIRRVTDEVVYHNCDTIGGSSGSPVLHQDSSGNWRAIAVTHGAGGTQNFAVQSGAGLTCETYNRDTSPLSVSPSVDRFRNAPRFASNVAVNRSPSNASATAVFAIDSDRDIVTMRTRTGSTPTYNSEFTYWSSLGAPSVTGGTSLTKLAACHQSTSKPQVFVVVNEQSIYTRSVDSAGSWGSWTSFSLPSGVTSVQDLDTAYDSAGRCQLFMVAKGGSAYTRAKTSDTAWGSWSTVSTGTYKAVTAINADGVLWAALVDTSGDIWRTSRTTSSWSARSMLPRTGGLSWADVDMTWDEAGRAFMLAVPTTQTKLLYFTPMYGSNPWTWWTFTTSLWVPNATPPITPANPPRFVSITASRWMEDASGVVSPVIMTTDDAGNIYLVEYQRRVAPAGWDLRWKSFYHEFIPN